jgi:exo-beta-1,3-glucanase (GH17 family)
MTDATIGHERNERHKRFHAHHQRDIAIDTVTVVETAPAAYVMVDENGNPLYTSHVSTATPEVQVAAAAVPTEAPTTNAQPAAYNFPSQWKSHSSKSKSKSKSKTKTKSKTSTMPPPPPPTTTAEATPTSAASGYIAPEPSHVSNNDGYGVAYSPYDPNGNCIPADQVKSDFSKLKGFGYVRSYGIDCDQVPNMMQAAKANNMKIMLGLFNLGSYQTDVQSLISSVKANGGWGMVTAVSVGNEDLNQGKADVGTIVSATNGARTALRAAGYDGPVVHVDTFNQIIDHPELCEASDFVAANCHAFFSAITPASGAGDYVSEQVANLKKACPAKDVHITESGWPKLGSSNGEAIPSPENQQTALSSLKKQFSSNIVFYSAYNTEWKKDFDGSFGCEKYWGMFDSGNILSGF